jgi:uncharacterized integral membrane protein
MTDKQPGEQPTSYQPQIVPGGSSPGPDKRPVSVRAKETANAGYRIVRWIVLIILLVIAAVFIVRNFDSVPVDWVFGTTSVPLSLVMLGFLLAGLVIGWLIHWFSIRAQRRQ